MPVSRPLPCSGDWLIRQDQKPDGKIRSRMPKGGSYFDYEGDNNVPDEIAYPDLDTWTAAWQIPVVTDAILGDTQELPAGQGRGAQENTPG